MIEFEEFELNNGLKVIVHNDPTTPIVAFNMLYNVGARDEIEEKTGFAHLFEHLMFGGSINIESYDKPLQLVGGENNAFTSNDITNYYITLPKDSIETAFWLESDRMLSLAFSEESLNVQRNVVVEEFNQRYLNQPYGDAFLKLRPLAYKKHPYKWATIGKEVKHIVDAQMQDVKDFFYKFYRPNNAILSIAGNVSRSEIEVLADKWFGDIEEGISNENKYSTEPDQKEERRLEISADVPQNAIYMAFHMVGRNHIDYYATDMLSDILSQGSSSRLYLNLVKEKSIFSELSAYLSGEHDPGLFIISGRINEGVDIEDAENQIWNELDLLILQGLGSDELTKVKNKLAASLEYSNNSVLNKAMGLAFAKLLGDANKVNTELDSFNKVNENDIIRVAKKVFRKENLSVLTYKKK